MTIQELYAKRATAWENAKKFLDTRTQENGTLSAEDATTYERMEQDIKELTNQIERMTRLNEMENAMNQPTSNPLHNQPGSGNSRTSGQGNTTASDAYRKAFFDGMRSKFRNSADVLSVGIAADGGYTVPDEFANMIIEGLKEDGIMRRLATTIHTNSGTLKIPSAGDDAVASWVDEKGAYSQTDVSFGQVTLSHHKLGAIIKATEELLNDSAFNIEAYIQRALTRAMSVAEETAFITGTGVSPQDDRPTGVITDASGTLTCATPGTIKADDIINLIYDLKAPYRKRSVFMTNDATLAGIRKLKDGNGIYMWQPALTQGQPDRLMGYPVETSPEYPIIGATAGTYVPLLFGDFSWYYIAERKGMTIKALNELFAVNGQVGFLVTERVDGKLILPEAVRKLSTTIS